MEVFQMVKDGEERWMFRKRGCGFCAWGLEIFGMPGGLVIVSGAGKVAAGEKLAQGSFLKTAI